MRLACCRHAETPAPIAADESGTVQVGRQDTGGLVDMSGFMLSRPGDELCVFWSVRGEQTVLLGTETAERVRIGLHPRLLPAPAEPVGQQAEPNHSGVGFMPTLAATQPSAVAAIESVVTMDGMASAASPGAAEAHAAAFGDPKKRRSRLGIAAAAGVVIGLAGWAVSGPMGRSSRSSPAATRARLHSQC